MKREKSGRRLGLDSRFENLSFEVADSLLKESSKTYRQITDHVTSHGGYQINSEKTTEYYGCWLGERRVVTIRPEVKGALMVSVLAFEMTNAFQTDEHIKVDVQARNGLINQEQFVEAHETIEYQGQVMHFQILKELNKFFGKLPEEMFIFWTGQFRKSWIALGPMFWKPPQPEILLEGTEQVWAFRSLQALVP